MKNKHKNVDAFVEAPSQETGRRSGIMKLFIGDDGIDWSSIPDDKKADAIAAFAADDDVSETLRLMGGSTGSGDSKPALIKEKHVNFFLDVVEAAERFIIPRLVARKSIGGLPAGVFTIDADVANAAFKFPEKDREKLVPCGVEAANANLPEKVKVMIAKVGPGTEFVGRFFTCLQEQQMVAIKLQSEKISKDPTHPFHHHMAKVQANKARNSPQSAPAHGVRTAPPPKTNGAATASPDESTPRKNSVEEQTA